MSNTTCDCPSMRDGQRRPEHYLCLICSWTQFTEDYYQHAPSADRSDTALMEILNIWWIRYRNRMLEVGCPEIQSSQAYDLSNNKHNVSAR